MKKIMSGFLTAFLFLMSACGGGGGEAASDDITVSVKLLQGWQARETGKIVLVEYYTEQGALFSVTKEEGAVGKNLDEHLNNKKAFYVEHYKDVDWLGTEKRRIDGREALEVTFIARGFKQKDAYVQISKSLVLMFIIVAPVNGFESILEDYEEMLDSVKIK